MLAYVSGDDMHWIILCNIIIMYICKYVHNVILLHFSQGSCEDSYWCPSACETDIYNQMVSKKYVQIPSAAINRHEQLGEGEFGVVYKGQWDLTVGKILTVALKTLKSTASNDERVKLLQEAAIMGQFKHPHIVGMYGVAITAESVSGNCTISVEILCKSIDREYNRCMISTYACDTYSTYIAYKLILISVSI